MRRGLFGSFVAGLGGGAVSRSTDGSDSLWNGFFWSSASATGIQINQQTALQASAVMA
jgi:hypothetical protein